MNNLIKKQILLHTYKAPDAASIFIDSHTIIENYKNILNRAPKNFSLTFPVKSCPNTDFIKKIAPYLIGFEISNENELNIVESSLTPEHILLISNSFKPMKAASNRTNNLFDLGYIEQIELAKSFPQVSLRVQPDLKLEQTQKSRFGLDHDEIQVITQNKEISSKIVQLHFHIGFEKTTVIDLIASIKSCVKLAKDQLPSVKTLNIGGGVNKFSSEDFDELFDFIKNIDYQIILEAGRYFFKDASYACGKVLSIRQRQDSTHVLTNLSHESHLKWSWSSKFYILTNSQLNQQKVQGKIKFYGQTAYEDDCLLITELTSSLNLSIGDHIIFDNISGYSVAWNHDFNGVGLANVILL